MAEQSKRGLLATLALGLAESKLLYFGFGSLNSIVVPSPTMLRM